GTWSHRDIPGVATNDHVDELTGSGPADVWARTATNRLYRWTTSWTQVAVPAGTVPTAITSAGPNHLVFASGIAATWHWDGASWTGYTLPPLDASIVGLRALAPDDMYALTSRSLLHFDGNRWA